MKKFKKLTASLMALAITAAGMSSIPASAAYTSRTLYLGIVTATASVSYLSTQSYTATTAGNDYRVVRKTVDGRAYKANGGSEYQQDVQENGYWDAQVSWFSPRYTRCTTSHSALSRYKNGSNPNFEKLGNTCFTVY